MTHSPCATHFQNFISENENLENFFSNVVRAISNIPYTIIGSLARKCYIDHRAATKDIDFLLLHSHRKNLRAALSNISYDDISVPHPSMIHITRNNCAVKIEFLVATEGFDPEESCVNDVEILNIYDLPVHIAKPEYLVWLLARSPHERHRQDMLKLLQSGKVDVKRLLSWMQYSGDSEEISILKNLIAPAHAAHS